MPIKIQERDAVILRARLIDGRTLQSIATEFGISRERVRQLLKRYGVTSNSIRVEKPELVERAMVLFPLPVEAVDLQRAAEGAEGSEK